MINILGTALTALNAFSRKLGVSANNIANVNTDGFKKSRAVLEEESPYGVNVNISRVDTPGSLIPSFDESGEAKESSNVSLEEEIIGLKIAENGFKANLKALKAADEALGSLLDKMG